MLNRIKNSTLLGVSIVAVSWNASAGKPPVDLAQVMVQQNVRIPSPRRVIANGEDTRPRFRGRNELRPEGGDDIAKVEGSVAPPAIDFPAGAKQETEMQIEAMPVMEVKRPVALLSVEVLVARLAVVDHLKKRYAADITACHAFGDGANEATISVAFDVDPQGGVQSLVVSSMDPRVRQCVSAKAAGWRFTNGLGDVIEVEASLLVHPGGLTEDRGGAGFGRRSR